MKIITPGKPPERKPLQLSCQHCATVVEADPRELVFVPTMQGRSFWTCDCPVCGGAVVTASLNPVAAAAG